MRDTVINKEDHLTLQFALFDLRHDLREIIEKFPLPFLILNKKGEIMLANTNFWKKSFGYDVCEMIGKKWSFFTKEKDRISFSKSALSWRTKSGEYRMIHWSASPLKNGKMICIGNLLNTENDEN